MRAETIVGESVEARPFNKRGWVVFVLGLSAVVLLVSGVVLFIAPSSRIAKSIDWDLWALDREAWVNLHNVVAILFSAVVVWHLAFNWKPLCNYIGGARPRRRIKLLRELLAATATLVIIVGLVAAAVPPISTLGSVSNYFRHEYWK
ncbi:DUF4405 domain-containing protein [Rhodoplanes azumiensis]|uniref:DUF4405 domain-containing protein n=1 Tax=Rhodoplanes azumiensis TaxID=1897628 RepID=A0ABW5AHM6_9BRAD